mgnify:CR=1 FL=1
MTRIVSFAQRYLLVTLVISFVLGAVFGLVVLGWYVWPVKWSDALIADLGPTGRQTYLTLVAESYELTKNDALAKQHLRELYPNRTPAEIGAELDKAAAGRDPVTAEQIRRLVVVLGPSLAPSPVPGGTGQLPVSPKPPTTLLRRLLQTFGLVILVLVILAGLLLLVYFLQSRTTASSPRITEATEAAVLPETESTAMAPPSAAPSGPEPEPATPPPATAATLGSFVATYNLGDIDFDMSFGIEAPNGDFLGECGLGMAEAIGGGEVQRVSAFEVWLFDKIDIRTVSIVLASAHAHTDPALRTKLASRGEIVLAEPGQVFSVRTSSLKLQGRILDMAYGGGDVPAQSYFTTFSVELTPSQVASSEGAA